MLDNPLTQSLMSNPDVIRQMLESNPQMQEVTRNPAHNLATSCHLCTPATCAHLTKPLNQVMERNPEIRQMLNNPEVLRQVRKMANWTIDDDVRPDFLSPNVGSCSDFLCR